MTYRHFIALTLVALLAGCVSVNLPIPADYNGPLARITDTSQAVSSTKVQFFELTKIDSRSVESSTASTYKENYGRGFSLTPKLESREVPAKTSVLDIKGVTYVAAPILAFGGGIYHVEGQVTVSLEPAKTYFVKGTLTKEYSAVWLEDAEGHVVSSKVEKGKKAP